MSHLTREVVTLQFGHYSNFVGTQWWNIQNSSFIYHPSQITGLKEINSDVLFREGQNLQGEVTYTPRLISFDLKGSLNTLKQADTLYDVMDCEDQIDWLSDVTLHKLEGLKKNDFLNDLEYNEKMPCQNESTKKDDTNAEVNYRSTSNDSKLYSLEDTVQVWSDILRPHLHPRSIHLINNYQFDRDCNSFDLFGYGMEVYSTPRYRHEIEDRLHFFTEECDSLQGFQVMTEPFNGFGGLSSSLLEEVADDFQNKSIVIFGLEPVFPNITSSLTVKMDAWYRTVNTVLTYARIIGSNSLLMPLSLSSKQWQCTGSGSAVHMPHVTYHPDLPYHTSSILASTIDCLTLPYRLLTNQSSMTDLTRTLMLGGRKVVEVETMYPFPMHEFSSLADTLAMFGVALPSTSLTSSCQPGITPDAVSVVLRGIPENRLQSNKEHSMGSRSAYGITYEYFQNKFRSAIKTVCVARQPCEVAAPFPHIFDSCIDSKGFISSDNRQPHRVVDSVPMMTLVRSSQSVRGHLEDLLSEVAKINLHRLHREKEAGLEADEFEEAVDLLRAHCQLYDADTGEML